MYHFNSTLLWLSSGCRTQQREIHLIILFGVKGKGQDQGTGVDPSGAQATVPSRGSLGQTVYQEHSPRGQKQSVMSSVLHDIKGIVQETAGGAALTGPDNSVSLEDT